MLIHHYMVFMSFSAFAKLKYKATADKEIMEELWNVDVGKNLRLGFTEFNFRQISNPPPFALTFLNVLYYSFILLDT